MKLKKPRRKIITQEVWIELFRLLFGSLILIFISSRGQAGFITGTFISIILASYLVLSAHVFDLVLKFSSFLYRKYLKDLIDGIRRAHAKIQGGVEE